MTQSTIILVSFMGFLLGFFAVGVLSAVKARPSRDDYYLAGRTVSPWLAGLSAVATNNSGYMFIGVIGFTYASGLSAVWLMVGWIAGDWIASLFIHRRLRAMSAATGEASYAAVISRWADLGSPFWGRLAGTIMVLFLGAYAAAQLSAGGKALQGTLGWDPDVGVVLVAAMVLVYSVAGGIRASIWTDAAQSSVMLIAMGVLCFEGIAGLGGWGAALDSWRAVPGFFDLDPGSLLVPGGAGLALFAVGWMFAGFSVVGQPHIMVRFMALDATASFQRTRLWYYGYFTVFYALATLAGMLSRLYLPELGGMDRELALPTMAAALLPPALVGLVLAGIFAATMSTADSLVLSCSSALTQDLLPGDRRKPWQLKTATAAVTGLALYIALHETRGVFDLVVFSWSALASAFAPILILLAFGRRIGDATAVALTISGVAIAVSWRMAGWHDAVYEGLPGILGPLIAGFLLSAPRQQTQVRPAGSRT